MVDKVIATAEAMEMEGPEGKAFHTRSRVFTAEELLELQILP